MKMPPAVGYGSLLQSPFVKKMHLSFGDCKIIFIELRAESHECREGEVKFSHSGL